MSFAAFAGCGQAIPNMQFIYVSQSGTPDHTMLDNRLWLISSGKENKSNLDFNRIYMEIITVHQPKKNWLWQSYPGSVLLVNLGSLWKEGQESLNKTYIYYNGHFGRYYYTSFPEVESDQFCKRYLKETVGELNTPDLSNCQPVTIVLRNIKKAYLSDGPVTSELNKCLAVELDIIGAGDVPCFLGRETFTIEKLLVPDELISRFVPEGDSVGGQK
jgi:hypothetical protein